MKKIIIVILSVFALLAVEFYVGFMMGKSSETITIKLKNKAKKNISSVTLEHDFGNALKYNIKKGSSSLLQFHSKEKNKYRIKVVFDDNKSLFSTYKNVAPGSVVIESIEDSQVVSSLK